MRFFFLPLLAHTIKVKYWAGSLSLILHLHQNIWQIPHWVLALLSFSLSVENHHIWKLIPLEKLLNVFRLILEAKVAIFFPLVARTHTGFDSYFKAALWLDFQNKELWLPYFYSSWDRGPCWSYITNKLN